MAVRNLGVFFKTEIFQQLLDRLQVVIRVPKRMNPNDFFAYPTLPKAPPSGLH